MYKIIDIEQRSEEWFSYRGGRLTASNAHLIAKPVYLSTTVKYINDIIDYRLNKVLNNDDLSEIPAIARGIELEPEAVDWLRCVYDPIVINTIGLVIPDNPLALFSASPDAVIMEDGKIVKGFEIKVPSSVTRHLSYKVNLPKQYDLQCDFSAWVCGLDEWTFCSFYPEASTAESRLITRVVKQNIEWQPLIDKMEDYIKMRIKHKAKPHE